MTKPFLICKCEVLEIALVLVLVLVLFLLFALSILCPFPVAFSFFRAALVLTLLTEEPLLVCMQERVNILHRSMCICLKTCAMYLLSLSLSFPFSLFFAHLLCSFLYSLRILALFLCGLLALSLTLSYTIYTHATLSLFLLLLCRVVYSMVDIQQLVHLLRNVTIPRSGIH